MTIDNVGLIRLCCVALDKHWGSSVNVSVIERSQFSFLFDGVLKDLSFNKLFYLTSLRPGALF